MKTYFIADPHFDHANMIKMCCRPFKDVNHMNQSLVNNWNSVVKPEDRVYILGDFSMKAQAVIDYLHKLNGRKILIRGNHDKKSLLHMYDEVYDYLELNLDGKQLVLSHYPLYSWNGMHRDSIHLYGHVHNELMSHPFAAYCVSVENIGYTPRTLDEIINMYKKKWSKND